MSATAAPADRRTRLLEEALALVAAKGLGALTHRAVESRAGVPHGTVTYWFGGSDGLLDALVDLLVERCEEGARAIAERIAAAYAAGDEPDVDAAAEQLAAWIDEGRELHLARLELELAGARDPRLRRRMADAASVFKQMCEPLARASGSPDPERDGYAMTILVDGLLLDRLAHEEQTHELLVATVRHILGSWAE